MDMYGQIGLKRDLLKLKLEMLNFKTKDVGPMDCSSDHLQTMLMQSTLFNSYNKMLLDSLQIMLELNQSKKLNLLQINCQHTVICSNKMLSKNSNPSQKLNVKEQLENKFLLFSKTFKLNQKLHQLNSKPKKSMLPLPLPNSFLIQMLKQLG